MQPFGSFFWGIYESTLFTPDGDWSPDIRPLRLDIRYLRNIESANLVEQTRKEWQSQGITSEQHDRWLAVLETIWPNVTPGDVISLSIDLEGRSTFSFNGNRVGSIEAAGFGADFAGIWLSPSTSRPKLRAALIGLGKLEAHPCRAWRQSTGTHPRRKLSSLSKRCREDRLREALRHGLQTISRRLPVNQGQQST